MHITIKPWYRQVHDLLVSPCQATAHEIMAHRWGHQKKSIVRGCRHGRDSGDQLLPRYNKDQGCWTGPFIMSSVNTRIVRRSAALQHSTYGMVGCRAAKYLHRALVTPVASPSLLLVCNQSLPKRSLWACTLILSSNVAGEEFTYNEAFKPGGFLNAVALSVATLLGGAAIVVPPLRFLLRKVIPKPGEGEPFPTGF